MPRFELIPRSGGKPMLYRAIVKTKIRQAFDQVNERRWGIS
jgi:hypothetical protein